jgi:hypothetical protein
VWQLFWLKQPSMKAFTGVRLNRVAIDGGIPQLAVPPSLPPSPLSTSAHSLPDESTGRRVIDLEVSSVPPSLSSSSAQALPGDANECRLIDLKVREARRVKSKEHRKCDAAKDAAKAQSATRQATIAIPPSLSSSSAQALPGDTTECSIIDVEIREARRVRSKEAHCTDLTSHLMPKNVVRSDLR